MFRKLLAALSGITPFVKRLDWVGRVDDGQTVGAWGWKGLKWLFVTAASAVGGWIMGNVEVAFFIFLGLGLIVVLIGPSVTEEWAERRLARKRKEKRERKRLEAERKRLDGGGDILPDMEQLAENLQAERQDREGEDIALLNRNRDALAEIVKALDERDIPHPLLPPHGDTEEWETFLWNFIRRVRAGEAEKLPTLYDDLRKAVERRARLADPDYLFRRYLAEQEDAEEATAPDAEGVPNPPSSRAPNA